MDYVSYWDNVISKEKCKEIIQRFEERTEQHEATVLEGHRHFTEINITNYIDTWSDIQNLMLDEMQFYLGQYMRDWKVDGRNWPKDLAYEQFRMKRYLPNDKDEFKFHVDVGDYASARRFLVMFFYLNDVEEGGETVFKKSINSPVEFACKPVAGRMIIFPPFWTFPHAGAKPISGPKYIIGGYLHYL
jgi:prolyl 4-hydroxylase